MIVADTSAFMAILLREDDGPVYEDALKRAGIVYVAAPTAFELRLALYHKRGASALPGADLVLQPPIEIVPWADEHVSVAIKALRRFGGRPARLNFGDCMTYALATTRDLPLLYKGNDFAHTDIRSALAA